MSMNAEKKQSLLYRVIYWVVERVYPKIDVVGTENLPDEASVIVGNHAQLHGPLAGELYFPGKHYIWCAAEMMELKEVPAYAYWDFWRNKPKAVRWIYKMISYVIAPLSVCIFNNAHTIGVYHDKRVVSTFKNTIVRLKEGANVVIFPEHDAPRDHILCEFQEGFVEVARTYYKQTGKALAFVPMYLAPTLHKMCLGKPIYFCPENPMKEERGRICEELMTEISRMAVELPRHRVVPYNNLPKKAYVYNKEEVCTDEKAGC